MPRLQSLEDLEARRAACVGARDPAKPCLALCAGSGCTASGAPEVLAALRESLERAGLEGAVELKSTGCHGFCEKGPVMLTWPEGTFSNQVAGGGAKEIVASVSNGRRPVERLVYRDPTRGERGQPGG